MTSTEYWVRAALLLHTDVEGKRDIGFDPNVRFYFYSCRTHNDDRSGPLMRALFVAMDEWVTHGIEPPPSNNPKIANGTLVDPYTYRKSFPAIPGVQTPESFYMPYRLDPRPSILERYPTRADYLTKVTDAALKLKAQRFLLDEDAVNLINKAASQQYWDD